MMRNNRWYRDDALEVLVELLKSWESALRTSSPTENPVGTAEARVRNRLSIELDKHARLNRYQIASGLEWSMSVLNATDRAGHRNAHDAMEEKALFPLRELSLRGQRSYYTLRFCGMLSAVQRAALISGRLPIASLSQQQIEYASFLLPECCKPAARQAQSASEAHWRFSPRVPNLSDWKWQEWRGSGSS